MCPTGMLFRSVRFLADAVCVSCCTGLLKMCSGVAWRLRSKLTRDVDSRLVARLPHDARAMRRPAFHLVVPQSFARDTRLYVVPPPHHIHKATRHTLSSASALLLHTRSTHPACPTRPTEFSASLVRFPCLRSDVACTRVGISVASSFDQLQASLSLNVTPSATPSSRPVPCLDVPRRPSRKR